MHVFSMIMTNENIDVRRYRWHLTYLIGNSEATFHKISALSFGLHSSTSRRPKRGVDARTVAFRITHNPLQSDCE